MNALLALFALGAPALAFSDAPRGGTLEGYGPDGAAVALPLLRSDVDVQISGDLASVKVTQTFMNPGDTPLNARYLFPLPEDAAVWDMRFVVGDLVIEGEIQRKAEAQATFDAAKAAGQQAALLTQHRPNVFTQEVANLPGGQSVKVEIQYAHAVPRLDGAYTFHFPMVVGPRYLPDGDGTTANAPAALNQWTLPGAHAPLAAPGQVDADRVGLSLRLEGGAPLRWVESPSHPITRRALSDTRTEIGLEQGRVLDNADFVLRYALSEESITAAVTTQAADGAGTLSLLLDPPQQAGDAVITPRELVFVLDTSGSMSGAPIQASKRFMDRALRTMRPGDTFRVLQFSDSARTLSEEALPYTPENLSWALRYVGGLEVGGGTQMEAGLRAALEPPVGEGRVRLVVFLTDGYIGNDAEILTLVEALRGEARLFSFGIGSSVNRWLLEEMARVGRGVARVVTDEERADAEADRLAARLAAPYLTDVRIDWGAAPVTASSPGQLPDLFLGEPLRVLARYSGSGRFPVVVRGRLHGEPVELVVELALPEDSDGGRALPLVWARAQVEDRMARYLSPGAGAEERVALEEEITGLGLEHRLVTQWTSFVAVAREAPLAQGPASDADVAVPVARGVPAQAYSGPDWGGGAAPEPATWLALAAVGALGGLARKRGRG